MSDGGIDVPTAELVAVALDAAGRAAELILEGRPEHLEVDTKTSATDHVTNMDLASEELIRSVISAARPQDTIIGEESSGDGSVPEQDPQRVTWLIDPIDGTTNYLYDLPGYNISIAALVGEHVVVGVVADPSHGRVYHAVRGGGSFCNGSPLGLVGDRGPSGSRVQDRSSGAPSLETALIATGFAYSPAVRARQGRVVADLLPRVRDIRRLGAAALDLCHVAAGRVDGYFEVGLAPWDVAAGSLIATEAGAVVEAIRGGPPVPRSVVAAHPAIAEDLQALLSELGAGPLLDHAG